MITSDSLEPSGSRTITSNGTSGLFMSEYYLSRAALRKLMKAKRSALSLQHQQQAAENLLISALPLLEKYRPKIVAFYLPFNGEISPLPLMEYCLAQGIKCVLPVLHPFSSHYLQFVEYVDENALVLNHFGIQEPKLDVTKVVPYTEIDLLFTPLVACDKQNNRLGMGGGFYDRTLAYMPNTITVGLAYQCQQVEQLPTESWDMPLKYILLG